jgi:hypothetical protein
VPSILPPLQTLTKPGRPVRFVETFSPLSLPSWCPHVSYLGITAAMTKSWDDGIPLSWSYKPKLTFRVSKQRPECTTDIDPFTINSMYKVTGLCTSAKDLRLITIGNRVCHSTQNLCVDKLHKLKVRECYKVTFANWTSVFDWCVVR